MVAVATINRHNSQDLTTVQAAFDKNKALFTRKLDLNLRNKLGLYLEHSVVWC